MSDNFYQNRTPEQSLKLLLDEGTKILVDCDNNEVDKPDWIDDVLLEKARAAMKKFKLGIQFSNLTGLLLILQLPDALEPLLSTGNSKDIPALFKRYIATIVHVKSWYDDDVFDPQSKGYRSIRQVRAMHRRLRQIMNDKNEVKDVNGAERVWASQYDFAMTQFAFIGLAMLYPHKTGMILATEEELESINYYWRVLGSLMGIRNQFNLCQFDSYVDIKKFNKLVFDQEYLAYFKKFPCPTGLSMSQAIVLGLRDFLPLVTFNTLAHWWSDCFKFNGYEPQPLTMRERLLAAINNVSMNHLLRSESILNITTKLQEKRFEQRNKQKDKIYEKLKTKHANQKQFEFYSDRVEYFAKQDQPGINAEEGTKTEPPGLRTSGCPFGFKSASKVNLDAIAPASQPAPTVEIAAN